MLGDLGGWKIVILVVVLLVLFGGATRLPIFAKGLGQSVRVFRKELTGVKDDIDADKRRKAKSREGVDGESTGNDLAHDAVFVTKDPPAESDLPPKATSSGAPKP